MRCSKVYTAPPDTAMPVVMVMKKQQQCNCVAGFGKQWRSRAQRNKVYQVWATRAVTFYLKFELLFEHGKKNEISVQFQNIPCTPVGGVSKMH